MEKKFKVLIDVLGKYDCDAILFTEPKNIRYFCGFRGDNGILLYTPKEMILITDPRFELEAKKSVTKARIVINKKESSLWEVPEIYEELKIKKLGFSPKTVTVEVYSYLNPLMELIPIQIIPSAYRYIKGADEIKLMRKAIEIHEKSLIELLDTLPDHPTEKIFAANLDHNMRLNGAEDSSFDTIVAFAENSAIVHARPSEKKIEGNGFLLIDFGAVYDGYCSDETVTFIMGEPTKQMTELYDLVHTAQRRAIDAIKPGVTAVELYERAYGYLIKEGYGKYIQHSLGHHLGLDIHEYPKIFPFTEFTFEEGMVFTVEPGLYVPDLGGVRLEEMVRVTADGCEVLTKLPKEKRIII